jgi:hypothetical protein
MFHSRFFSLVVVVSTITTLLLPVTVDAMSRANFVFSHDTNSEACEEAKRMGDEEDFRLFCINEAHAFEHCAISCSKALEFEGTVANSKRPQDFYDLEFGLSPNPNAGLHGGEPYGMSQNKGKVTVFAIIPLMNSQAQYMYELLEEVKERFATPMVDVVATPMFIEEAVSIEQDPMTGKLSVSGVTFQPYPMDQRVSLLQMSTPETIGAHPFLGYLPKLYLQSGFSGFDVYTDRTVVFVISNDARTVERLVMPSLDSLEKTILKHMGGVSKAYKTEK